jgi:hypothetical protein
MLNTKRATLVQLAQYETRYTLVQLAQYKTRFTSLIMLPHCNMRFSELFWICFTNPLTFPDCFFYRYTSLSLQLGYSNAAH